MMLRDLFCCRFLRHFIFQRLNQAIRKSFFWANNTGKQGIGRRKRAKKRGDLPFAKHPVNLTVCRVVDLVTAVLMTMRNHCLNHVNPMANEIWNAIKKPVQNLCSFQKKSWKLQFTAANKRLTFGLQNCSSFWTFIMRSRISCGWNGKQMKQLVDATTLINLAKKHLVGFFLVSSWKKQQNWIE